MTLLAGALEGDNAIIHSDKIGKQVGQPISSQWTDAKRSLPDPQVSGKDQKGGSKFVLCLCGKRVLGHQPHFSVLLGGE